MNDEYEEKFENPEISWMCEQIFLIESEHIFLFTKEKENETK